MSSSTNADAILEAVLHHVDHKRGAALAAALTHVLVDFSEEGATVADTVCAFSSVLSNIAAAQTDPDAFIMAVAKLAHAGLGVARKGDEQWN